MSEINVSKLKVRAPNKSSKTRAGVRISRLTWVPFVGGFVLIPTEELGCYQVRMPSAVDFRKWLEIVVVGF